MRIATVMVPVLLGLAAAPTLGQPSGAPAAGGAAKGGQGEMSYEDYLLQRARMLLRMRGASPQQQPQQPARQPEAAPAQDGAAKDGAGKGGQDSSYGQGYATRQNAEDGTAHKAGGARARPERPRVERPHADRPERPQIERPGRP